MLRAQTVPTDIRVVAVPMVKVYLGPLENGTEEESEYFTSSLIMEFTSAGYQMVDVKEESDYNITMEISRYEDDPPNGIGLILYETGSGREVITQSYGYQDPADMNMWNLYAITQMMANTPVIKIMPDAEMLGVMPKNEEPKEEPEEGPDRRWPPRLPVFYLGLRAGGVFDFSFIQNSGGYEGGVGRGFGGEVALLVEFQPFRYLSLQTEGVVIYDTFMASRITQSGGVETRFTGAFQSLSLMIPLWIKIPVPLDKLVLSPFVGGYYLLPLDILDKLNMGFYKLDPPFGLSLGFEWGIPRNSRMLFFGLRFDYDIGLSIVEEVGGLQYSRTRIGLFLGYKFSLLSRRDKKPVNEPINESVNEPVNESINEP
jgi:hypothetical protein